MLSENQSASEDLSGPYTILHFNELFNKELNPYIENTERISEGNAAYRYFSSDIIVKQFNGMICSPFTNVIDTNYLVIDEDLINNYNDLKLERFMNKMFTDKNDVRYKFCRELIKCLSSDIIYVVFHVSLQFTDFYHANIVIIDKTNHEEYKYFIFEPHGYNSETNKYGNTNIERKDVSNFLSKFFNILKNNSTDMQEISFDEVIKRYTGYQKKEINDLEKDQDGEPIKLIKNKGLCVTHVLLFAFIFFNLVFGGIRQSKTMFDISKTFEDFFEIDQNKYTYNTIENLIDNYGWIMDYTGTTDQWIHETLIAFNNKLTMHIYTVYLFQYNQYRKGDIRVTRQQLASNRFDSFAEHIYNNEIGPMESINRAMANQVKDTFQKSFNNLLRKFNEEDIFTINGINIELINGEFAKIDSVKSLPNEPSKKQCVRGGKKLKRARKTEKQKNRKKGTKKREKKSKKNRKKGTKKREKKSKKNRKKRARKAEKKEKKRAKKTEKKNRKKRAKKTEKKRKKNRK